MLKRQRVSLRHQPSTTTRSPGAWNMHDDAAVVKEREEVLADGFDARERPTVDLRRALGEPAVWGGGLKPLADEPAAERGRDTVDTVALHHFDGARERYAANPSRARDEKQCEQSKPNDQARHPMLAKRSKEKQGEAVGA